MDGDQIERDMARIDAALARIEAAATRLRDGDAGMAARHDRLRSAVSQSLHELDALIAGQGQ